MPATGQYLQGPNTQKKPVQNLILFVTVKDLGLE